jgi:hypothetical protein
MRRNRRVIKAKVVIRSNSAAEVFGVINAMVMRDVAAGLGKNKMDLHKSSSGSLDVLSVESWACERGTSMFGTFYMDVRYKKVKSTRFKLSKDDVAALQLVKEIFEGYNYSVSMTGCYTGSYVRFMYIRWSPSAVTDLSVAWSKAKDIKAQAGPFSGQRSMSPQ